MKSVSDESQEQRDSYFMALALDEAKTAAANGQTPFGAVVVSRDGKVLGQGHNTVRADLDPTAHGEIVAIRRAWRSLGNWHDATRSSWRLYARGSTSHHYWFSLGTSTKQNNDKILGMNSHQNLDRPKMEGKNEMED